MANDYSIYTGIKREFGVLDYILFSLLFIVSVCVGFYHAFRDRKSYDVNTFHLGGRKMHPVPVSLSLVVTFLSAITIIGTPSEIYTFGTMFTWLAFGMLLAAAGSAHIFLPIFYNLNLTSTFGYLQMRFGTVIRIVTSLLFLLQTLLYMGFVLYLPSLAFQAVTGLSLWGTMAGVASVCTLYTMLGGMKTVVWTDNLQFAIMVIGMIVLFIKGSVETGGFYRAWEIANKHGRIEFTNFSFDPRTRHTAWSLGIGGGLFWLFLYGINQSQVQRECCLPTLRSAQIAIWLNFPGVMLIHTLACMIGVVMFAFYSECDPVKVGLVDKNDQIAPLMVLDVLGTIPGLSGIFVTCVFSGSLSSISSGLNAMSAIIIEDYVKCFCFKSLSGKRELMLTKFVVLMTGLAMLGFAAFIAESDQIIIQELSYSLYSMLSGPVFGCFVVGMIFPWTNKHGALFGLITSLCFSGWLVIGTQIHRPHGSKPLPVFTNGCVFINDSALASISNISVSTVSVIPLSLASMSVSSSTDTYEVDPTDEPIVYDFYRMSYQWYCCFGVVVNIVVSLSVSFITGYTDPKSVNSKLMCPLFYKLTPFLSERIRHFMYLGVNYENKDTEPKIEEELELFVGPERNSEKPA